MTSLEPHEPTASGARTPATFLRALLLLGCMLVPLACSDDAGGDSAADLAACNQLEAGLLEIRRLRSVVKPLEPGIDQLRDAKDRATAGLSDHIDALIESIEASADVADSGELYRIHLDYVIAASEAIIYCYDRGSPIMVPVG